jgi:glutamyl/glutaminyl-tRNA synthetase
MLTGDLNILQSRWEATYHISNTPKQILIYRAFGWDIPAFAHLPMILNEDRTKISKRKNKVSVDDYLAEGYLPELS